MSKTVKGLAFTGLVIAMFMGILDSTVVNIALPKLQTAFNVSATTVSWVATSYLLSLSVFLITSAKIADQFGRKKLMLIGLVIFGGFSLASAFAQSIWALVVFRFFQGIGGAIITPIVLPMGIAIFGKDKLPFVASVGAAVSAAAAAAGPPLGGILLRVASWRWIFGINLPFALIALVLVTFCIRETYDETSSKHVDVFGIVLFTIALFALVFALLKSHDFGWSSIWIWGNLIVAAVFLIAFLLVEKFSQYPMLDLSLFREKTFTSSTIVFFIVGFSLVAPTLILNYFLQDVKTYSPLHAALIIMTVSLTIIISMPLGTKIADGLDARWVNLMGMALMVFGLGAFGLIKLATAPAMIVVFLIVFGLGFGFSAQSVVSAVKHIPIEKNGIASGVVNAARQIGTCLGIAILMTCLSSNLTTARHDIRTSAVTEIQKQHLAQSTKTALIQAVQHSATITTKQVTAIIKGHDPIAPARGTTLGKLYTASQQLATGTEKISAGVSPVKSGLEQLSEGQQHITVGLTAAAKTIPTAAALTELAQASGQAATGAAKLAQAAGQLTNGELQLASGQQQVSTGIAQLAQGMAVQSAFSKIQHTKNQQITAAFARVYLVAALVTLVCLPVAWWTDRKGTAQA
jgi:EmrB/QacA subfamily drug resistance transporter